MPARPVRVQPVGCGCDDTSCEFSRWRDGYEICVLDACPDSHLPPAIDQFLKPSSIPDCPPCPTDPWIVLAVVTVDAQGNVGAIDNCKCRRMVRTVAPYWWKCAEPAIVMEPPATAPTKVPGTPGRITPPVK